jgi:cytochrome c
MKSSGPFYATTAVLLWAGSACAQGAPQGDAVFKRNCAVCHTVEAGKNRIGPSLFGVVGRVSGTAPGFKYSDAMTKAAWTWNEENLNKYLTDPKAAIPGNKMVFAGVKKDDDRAALVSYLATMK